MRTADAARRESRGATIAMVLVGLGALGWTTHAGVGAARLTWGGARAVAVAVPASPGGGAGDGTLGKPMMEFRLPSGEAVRFRQNGFGPSRVGDAAEVAYHPADPAGTASVVGWPLWVAALWVLPMGLGFTLLPLFGVRAAWGGGRW